MKNELFFNIYVKFQIHVKVNGPILVFFRNNLSFLANENLIDMVIIRLHDHTVNNGKYKLTLPVKYYMGLHSYWRWELFELVFKYFLLTVGPKTFFFIQFFWFNIRIEIFGPSSSKYFGQTQDQNCTTSFYMRNLKTWIPKN